MTLKANEEGRPPANPSDVHPSLALQGRYRGYVTELKPGQKAQIRKIGEAKGVRVAIERQMKLVQR